MSQQEGNRPEEIDLREAILIIMKRKKLIFVTMISALVLSSIYCAITKPIYRGEALVEVGEVILTEEGNTKNIVVQPIDNSSDIQEIIVTIIGKEIDKDSMIKIAQPRGGLSLMKVHFETVERGSVNPTLQKVVKLILSRHKEKADFYSKSNLNIRHSRQVGEIYLKDDPIRPNVKKIITGALFGGFLVGLFSIFIFEFMQKRKD